MNRDALPCEECRALVLVHDMEAHRAWHLDIVVWVAPHPRIEQATAAPGELR